MVTVICPKCKAELECEEGDLEAATACPQCGTPFVPADAVKPVAAPPPPPAPTHNEPALTDTPDVSAMQNAALIRELHAIADNQAKALAVQDRSEKLIGKIELYLRCYVILTLLAIIFCCIGIIRQHNRNKEISDRLYKIRLERMGEAPLFP